MAGRLQQLNTSEGGINRLKNKGGASKKNLYDLVNGYVDADGVPQSRPGTVQDVELPTGTKGLVAFDGKLVVFSHTAQTIADSRYLVETVMHPTDISQAIVEIHFAGAVLGSLYVAVEFANADVYHYWLQHREPWSADTDYKLGDVVEPTTPNGLAYRASRIGAAPTVWAPNVTREVGDVLIPTTENGFDYTVTAVAGTDPKSGATEPTWPESDGATVYEDTNLGDASADDDDTSGQVLPADVAERYSPPAWWKFDGGEGGTPV